MMQTLQGQLLAGILTARLEIKIAGGKLSIFKQIFLFSNLFNILNSNFIPNKLECHLKHVSSYDFLTFSFALVAYII